MGQIISVAGTTLGATAIFEADRSLSGQDGGSYESSPDTAEDTTFPARLAAEIFAADPGVTRVFVGSNGIVVHRDNPWSDPELERIGSVIEDFFVFYDD